jgi:hypothetical protein
MRAFDPFQKMLGSTDCAYQTPHSIDMDQASALVLVTGDMYRYIYILLELVLISYLSKNVTMQ